ncbi:MAG: Fe-S cluster assembly protein SufD [Myxococcota bacterium]
MSRGDEARERWKGLFAGFAAGREGSDPAEWTRRRAAAMASFEEQGLPTTRWEEWRYTSLAGIEKTGFRLARADVDLDRAQLEPLCVPVFACSLVVFVNGRFAPGLSAPGSGGPELTSLAAELRERPDETLALLAAVDAGDWKGHPFAALNDAFVEDGAVLRLPRDRRIETPIHLVFVSTGDDAPGVQHPRVLVDAGPGSEATVIQDHVSIGDGVHLTNAFTQLRLGPNSKLDLVVLQRENDDTFHVSQCRAVQERDSRLACHTISLGGALVRNDLSARLEGEGAECTLRGLYVGHGDQVIDNHTWVDHAVPHCRSDELYKGVLGGAARGVFRGRVIVRPGAQKTDALQSNPNLLLSDRAEMDTKPQLEIHADDVKCSHGSTIGQIDPDALFYLRSRGLPEESARDLLTAGFAAEITEGLPAESLGDRVRELLMVHLGRAGVST